jgi:hypothetical protein
MIRLVRSGAILQTQAAELGESVEELSHERQANRVSMEDGVSKANDRFLVSVRLSISRFITSPVTAIIACVMAAVASIAEIIEDLRPGAHHGTCLLAVSELYYQIRRFRKVTGRKRLLPFKSHLGVPIALAAAAFAAFELYEDFQPGHHHGVALLALAELVENLNRSKLLYWWWVFGKAIKYGSWKVGQAKNAASRITKEAACMFYRFASNSLNYHP